MFRMIPGAGVPSHGHVPSPRAAACGGAAAVVAVALLGYLGGAPAATRSGPDELASAQRAAILVAGTYRASVDIDRRDRTLLVSYSDPAVMSADRIAWAVCDTIRSEADMGRAAGALRGWQVVALPDGGGPGSCRIGGLR
ncbi:MAG: hypothetical protein U1E17_19810 [Geminicoccaceae bacterium]